MNFDFQLHSIESHTRKYIILIRSERKQGGVTWLDADPSTEFSFTLHLNSDFIAAKKQSFLNLTFFFASNKLNIREFHKAQNPLS